MVKGELLAAGVRSGRSVGQLLAVDGLILHLSVCRLVDQLWLMNLINFLSQLVKLWLKILNHWLINSILRQKTMATLSHENI